MKIEEANEVVKFAEDVLHIELLPWQKYFIAIALVSASQGPAGRREEDHRRGAGGAPGKYKVGRNE